MNMRWVSVWLVVAIWAVNAAAQTVSSSPLTGGETALYATGTNVGNGADTTIDTLQTYTAPSGTLLNVGDAIHIVASGTFAASTDTKAARIQLNPVTPGPLIASLSGTAAAATAWAFSVWVVKTGSNTQSVHVQGTVISTAGAAGTSSSSITVPDTSPIVIAVQGQNATTATANSITCRVFLVSRRAAPGLM